MTRPIPPVSAKAHLGGISVEYPAPEFERIVYALLAFPDGTSIRLPILNETRTADTLLKTLPKTWVVTARPEE